MTAGQLRHIRAWREHRGLSLRQLEERTGLGRGHLSDWENGKALPSLTSLARLAAGLRVEVGQVYGPPPAPKKAKKRPKK
jgi:transcriptional regulator with XRE-family HTH domain